MSDRDLICKNCGKEMEARGWTHADAIFCDIPGQLQYAEPAAPVEPPVLSRAAIDEMIERKVWHKGPAIEMHMKIGAVLLRDAVLESLAPKEGE